MLGAIVGAVAGLFIAWLVLVGMSKFTYLGGGIGEFEGAGVLKSILFYGIFAVIGFFLGGILFSG
jgi:hypothetical protein